jgi:fucose permease
MSARNQSQVAIILITSLFFLWGLCPKPEPYFNSPFKKGLPADRCPIGLD